MAFYQQGPQIVPGGFIPNQPDQSPAPQIGLPGSMIPGLTTPFQPDQGLQITRPPKLVEKEKTPEQKQQAFLAELERQMREGLRGSAQQAREAGQQQQRRAYSLAASSPGVRTGQALRSARRVGQRGVAEAQRSASYIDELAKMQAPQMIQGILSLQQQQAERAASLDALYARMDLQRGLGLAGMQQQQQGMGYNILGALLSGFMNMGGGA